MKENIESTTFYKKLESTTRKLHEYIDQFNLNQDPLTFNVSSLLVYFR